MSQLPGGTVTFVFTDRHAYLQTANFFTDRSELATAVDFPRLQRRDFTRDPEHPERFERYQTEALAYRFVPVEAILGVCCYTAEIKHEIDQTCSEMGSSVKVHVRPEWYF